MMKKIDHLGIAVKDLAAAQQVYKTALGLTLESVEEVPTEQVRVAFFAIGETHIELLESTTPDGPIAKAIEKRGEGIHHIAFEVEDIRAAMANARAGGLQLLSEEPRPGAHGTQVVFVHPKSTGGVLVEFVQKPRA
jgi:methylmalonyl-CoA/ethylmalonyl-CoA epimerase